MLPEELWEDSTGNEDSDVAYLHGELRCLPHSLARARHHELRDIPVLGGKRCISLSDILYDVC